MSSFGDDLICKDLVSDKVTSTSFTSKPESSNFKFLNMNSIDGANDKRDDIVLLPVEAASLGSEIQLLPGPGGGAVALPFGYAIVLQRLIN